MSAELLKKRSSKALLLLDETVAPRKERRCHSSFAMIVQFSLSKVKDKTVSSPKKSKTNNWVIVGIMTRNSLIFLFRENQGGKSSVHTRAYYAQGWRTYARMRVTT
jgi:hypothetical protein